MRLILPYYIRQMGKRRRIRYETGPGPTEPAKPSPLADDSGVYARGQTVIPKTVREALGIEYGTRLRWEVREGMIHVIPIPQHPARALRGMLKGSGMTYEWFMQERQRERQREREQEQQWEQEHTPRQGRQRRPPGTS